MKNTDHSGVGGEQERLTLTVEEAGRKLGISRGPMYAAVRRGEVPSIRVGKRILIPISALLRLLGKTGDTPVHHQPL
ncbi:MAG: helix-turn-helix domain-containing protein [Dehalococcoidia bacterium]|nr:helix-turn-helix domain-containing protein [Dehalococcoidia bacterium]